MRQKCKGKNKLKQPCGQHPIRGREYCAKHGGKTPIGTAHPGFKHGLRSRYIPARLADKYAQSLSDPRLLEYSQDISFLEARLYELMETAESLPLWALTQDAYGELRKAVSEREPGKLASALAKLGGLINRGVEDALRWADIYRVMEQMGKTKEREHKRLIASEMTYTAEQLLGMLGVLVDGINRTFKNPEEIKSFQTVLNQFGPLLGSGSADNSGH